MTDSVLQLDSSSFERGVLCAEGPVLVDFYADWCAPCRVLGPTIETLAAQYAGAVRVGKVNVDANEDLAERFGVASLPTVLLFVNGEIVDRFVGLQPRDILARALDDAIRAVA